MKKENIGALVILGGVAILGYFWFKKNKPSLSKEQLAELTAESNSLKAGADKIDKPFEYSQDAINNAGSNPYTASTVNMSTLTQKEVEDIRASIGTIYDPSTSISNQISLNMQNADFSKLGSIDFTNIKIK